MGDAIGDLIMGLLEKGRWGRIAAGIVFLLFVAGVILFVMASEGRF